MKQTAGWLASALLAMALSNAGARAEVLNVSPAPDLTIERTTARVAKGDYLFNQVLRCAACHTPRAEPISYSFPRDKARLGAGRQIGDRHGDFPGPVYAPNITPAGVGGWSDGDLLRAIAYGVRPDGARIFPLMPYYSFAKMDRAEIYAVIAYMRTLPPVDSDLPLTALPPGLLANLPVQPADPKFGMRPPASDTVALGRYLADAAGCIICYTSRNPDRSRGPLLAGGQRFPRRTYVTRSANLTPDEETGMADMTRDEFIERFQAMSYDIVMQMPLDADSPNTPMPWADFAGMKASELGAIYDYLMTVDPVHNEVHTYEMLDID